MIKKFISIKNVGRFLNHSAEGDVELRRHNLIFAENGRGKTTLCALLRSLQSGDPSFVLGRKTLGVGGPPEIKILLDSGTSVFSKGAWNQTAPNIAIFDSMFVSENIYSGDTIGIAHRRNLYGVIVGKEGVAIANRIEKLDENSRTVCSEIRTRNSDVKSMVPEGLEVKNFLSLIEDITIDAKISDKEKELDAIRQGDLIKRHPVLLEITLPTFPSEFVALLGKTIEGVAEDAERRVTEHITMHDMHSRGELWLSDGLGYINNNRCPFCEQTIEDFTLIAAYKTYFSQAYKTLLAEINDLHKLIEDTFGDREIATVEKTLDKNTAAVEFWSRFCTITPLALNNSDNIGEILRSLRMSAIATINLKSANPLDYVETDTTFTTAQDALIALKVDTISYNHEVRRINIGIATKKTAIDVANVARVERELTNLKATKRRHEPDAKAKCRLFKEAEAIKKAIESEKMKVKKELDIYTQTVMKRYEQSINDLLADFHAGFKITETKHCYPGGVASCIYQILINETPVELGDHATPLAKPSFKNTLSSGDKSTLALSCFLAQLKHDPELSRKIIVFDDPFNSQDSFRKDCTVRKIKECCDDSKQVIVLSHDRSFLNRIYNRLSTDRKCLMLARVGVRDTRISEWDIEEAMSTPFFANRKALTDYYQKSIGRSTDIITKIRTVVETHCRHLFPDIDETDTLGNIISKIRVAGTVNQLYPQLGVLDALNRYTRQHHHGESPNVATEPINDSELHGYVKKTLDFIGPYSGSE